MTSIVFSLDEETKLGIGNVAAMINGSKEEVELALKMPGQILQCSTEVSPQTAASLVSRMASALDSDIEADDFPGIIKQLVEIICSSDFGLYHNEPGVKSRLMNALKGLVIWDHAGAKVAVSHLFFLWEERLAEPEDANGQCTNSSHELCVSLCARDQQSHFRKVVIERCRASPIFLKALFSTLCANCMDSRDFGMGFGANYLLFHLLEELPFHFFESTLEEMSMERLAAGDQQTLDTPAHFSASNMKLLFEDPTKAAWAAEFLQAALARPNANIREKAQESLVRAILADYSVEPSGVLAAEDSSPASHLLYSLFSIAKTPPNPDCQRRAAIEVLRQVGTTDAKGHPRKKAVVRFAAQTVVEMSGDDVINEVLLPAQAACQTSTYDETEVLVRTGVEKLLNSDVLGACSLLEEVSQPKGIIAQILDHPSRNKILLDALRLASKKELLDLGVDALAEIVQNEDEEVLFKIFERAFIRMDDAHIFFECALRLIQSPKDKECELILFAFKLLDAAFAVEGKHKSFVQQFEDFEDLGAHHKAAYKLCAPVRVFVEAEGTEALNIDQLPAPNDFHHESAPKALACAIKVCKGRVGATDLNGLYPNDRAEKLLAAMLQEVRCTDRLKWTDYAELMFSLAGWCFHLEIAQKEIAAAARYLLARYDRVNFDERVKSFAMGQAWQPACTA